MNIYEMTNLRKMYLILRKYTKGKRDDLVKGFITFSGETSINEIDRVCQLAANISEKVSNKNTSLSIPIDTFNCLSLYQSYLKQYGDNYNTSEFVTNIINRFLTNSSSKLLIDGKELELAEILERVVNLAESFDSFIDTNQYNNILKQTDKVVKNLLLQSVAVRDVIHDRLDESDDIDELEEIKEEYGNLNAFLNDYETFVDELQLVGFFDGSYLDDVTTADIYNEEVHYMNELLDKASDCYEYFNRFEKVYNIFIDQFKESGLAPFIENILLIRFPIRSTEVFCDYIKHYKDFLTHNLYVEGGHACFGKHSNCSLNSVIYEYLAVTVSDTLKNNMLERLKVYCSKLQELERTSDNMVKYMFPVDFTFDKYVNMYTLLSPSGLDSLLFMMSAHFLYHRCADGSNITLPTDKYLNKFIYMLDPDTQEKICRSTINYCEQITKPNEQ